MRFASIPPPHTVATASGPQRTPFVIPDYSRQPPLDVPIDAAGTANPTAAPVLIYSGWLFEAHTYDPANYRPAQSRPVHLRLDGTALRVSTVATGGANVRIARRATWQDAAPPLADRVATFTRHRAYEVRGALVRLLPVGLARKRHFSRKYPIEVVMRRGDEELPAVLEVLAATAATAATGAGASVPMVTIQEVAGEQLLTATINGEVAAGGGGSGERNFGEAIMFSNVSEPGGEGAGLRSSGRVCSKCGQFYFQMLQV